MIRQFTLHMHLQSVGAALLKEKSQSGRSVQSILSGNTEDILQCRSLARVDQGPSGLYRVVKVQVSSTTGHESDKGGVRDDECCTM